MPFAGLGGGRETFGNFFGRLDCDLETEISLKFLNDRRQSSSSVIVHPDQKFTIGPCEQFWRDKTESQQHQQQTLHREPGTDVRVLELPDTAGAKKSRSQVPANSEFSLLNFGEARLKTGIKRLINS